ncbi:MAG: T9SS type A sorting domain-containing protein [Flavobacterium sp.]|uniref:T9SS type A sorting domain-containing protein n=1 Tax=Flavobacterium sp. TaxID=239 RepID=UPI0022C3DB3A|nr:T9SS type A sorting domain-containing protein [Flavobacterium sp.]MCZ8197153.1 T9SS type A sorting domain-containing protein [Flavobacterium sp.]
MKKITLLSLLMLSTLGFAQFSTGTVTIPGSGMTVKIDTNTSIVTLTLTGPSGGWMGLGFGGSNGMPSVSDMFIWNSSANRDYTPSGSTAAPSADATASQSWTIVSDNVVGTTRTVVATRALVSAGDYTFTNSNSAIPIIYARGSAQALAYHGNNPHSGIVLQRTQLGVEDFSLNASSVYPNPSNGTFTISSKTNMTEINVYSQTGALVKTIKVEDSSEKAEVIVNGLQAGVYLIELKNNAEKSWKKVIVN